MSMKNIDQSRMIVHHWMECYNVTGELDDDDPRDINIPNFEGTQTVEGSSVSSDKFLNPLKIKKDNIGSS